MIGSNYPIYFQLQKYIKFLKWTRENAGKLRLEKQHPAVFAVEFYTVSRNFACIKI